MKFFQNARLKGQNSFISFIFSIALIGVFYIITSLPFTLYTVAQGFTNDDLSTYEGPLKLALILLVFSGILIGVLIATPVIHKRPVLSVLTGAESFRWRRVIRAGLLWLVMLMVLELIGYLIDPELYTFRTDLTPFFWALLVCVIVLPFQTSAEEVLLRGYLMQQIGLLTIKPWVPIIVTSLIFGLLHGGNPEVVQFGLAKSMTLYIAMGLFFGIITVMDDGLEAPLGIHYINNFFAFVIVGYTGSVFEGVPSLIVKETEELTWLAVGSNLAVMVVILLILKRMFKWPSFNILFRSITYSDSSLV